MLDLSQILLAQGSSDDGPMRFIGILIFIAIFIFGNLLQWWQKYQAEQRKRAAQRQAEAAANPPPMQRPAQRTAAPAPKSAPARTAPPKLQPPRTKPRGAIMQRTTTPGAPAAPGGRNRLAPLPPIPGVTVPPRRPAPPPARPMPAPQAAEPEMAPSARISGQDISASQIGSSAPSAPTRVSKIQAVLNPRTLKQVYILTEILQPPVSVRDEPVRSAS